MGPLVLGNSRARQTAGGIKTSAGPELAWAGVALAVQSLLPDLCSGGYECRRPASVILTRPIDWPALRFSRSAVANPARTRRFILPCKAVNEQGRVVNTERNVGKQLKYLALLRGEMTLSRRARHPWRLDERK
jgi:hypothetical protein